MATASPDAGQQHRAVPVHTSTEVLGLAMIAGAVLFMLTAGLLTGIPLGEAGFLVPMVVAPAIGAFLAWRFSTWGRAVGLLLGLAAAFMVFWLGFGIFVPASFVEFTAAAAYLTGVVMLLWGGIGALVRRDDVRTETPHSEMLLDRTAIAVVVLAFLVSLPLWMVQRTSVDAAAAAQLPTVTAANFAYEDVTAPAGGSIVVRNDDAFTHTFTVDELGIDVELLPRSSAVVDLPATTGSFTFYCIPHSSDAGAGEEDMAATLTIE